jgi:hypothetical protein
VHRGAPTQREGMEGERQYFTLRQIRRTLPMTYSTLLVRACEHR